ncbi:MAG: NAD(P)/FAD-dependent oxidoreductase [Lachnospiraceae bacterium]|nr:NAD(P)/FAD-dependent oxidoreductase [Lachnospiraceae bacterium]
MERYDAAILGTGPAGVSAAITLKIRNKNLLLIGNKDLSMKMEKAHEIQNYPGLPAIPGAELAAKMREHLDSMGIEITEDKVSTVYAMGDYFALQGATEMYEASTVILATGVVLAKPYPGEAEYLGKGVSYCATCDAPLYRGKTAAVIGFSPKEEAEADFLAELAEKVYYLPQYTDEVHVSDRVETVREKPLEILGDDKAVALKTSEREIPVDGVFILRESVAPSQLMPGLETEEGHVKVNRRMETNLAGCFACGDIVGLPYQYIKSAGEGNIAAISAAMYLDQKKREAAKKQDA